MLAELREKSGPQKRIADALNAQTYQAGTPGYALTTGSGTAYVAAFAPAITALTRGMRLWIEIHTTNTAKTKDLTIPRLISWLVTLVSMPCR